LVDEKVGFRQKEKLKTMEPPHHKQKFRGIFQRDFLQRDFQIGKRNVDSMSMLEALVVLTIKLGESAMH
jgi:hypothetical protein